MGDYLSKNGNDGYVLKDQDGHVLSESSAELIQFLKNKFIKEFTEKVDNLSKKGFKITGEVGDFFTDYEHEKIRYYYEKLGAEEFFNVIFEIYKKNKDTKKVFKSFTLYSFNNWVEIVSVDELFKFFLKILEYDISKLKEPVEEFLSNEEYSYSHEFLQGKLFYESSIVVNSSFCDTRFYQEFFGMHASRYTEFNFKYFESFVLDFVDMVSPVARDRCSFTDVKALLVVFRNLLGEFIVVSKEPSLVYILKFLELSQIEDSIIKIGEKKLYINGFTNYKHYNPKHSDNSLIYDVDTFNNSSSDDFYYARNIGGLTYMNSAMPYLTLFGQNIFYRIKEALENLSIKEKKEIINSKWWIDNGYREPANNVLSNEIKKYYIEPAIYGTPVPVDKRIKDILNEHNDKIQNAFDITCNTSYTNAIAVLTQLPLISLEAGTNEDRETILKLMEIVYNHFGDNEKKYNEFLIFNQKYLKGNINLIAWIEKCKNFTQIKEKIFPPIDESKLVKKLTPPKHTENK